MEIDRNGFEVLDREECLGLLNSATLGRIAFHSGALPVVLPVNFVVDDGSIVVRTGRGTKLDAATRNAVVAFEVDDLDPLYHTGWSVVVTGVATEITDPPALERARRLPLAHWGPDDSERFVAITTDLVSGRRLRGGHGERLPMTLRAVG